MADETPAAGIISAGRTVGPTAAIGPTIGRADAAAGPRTRPEDDGLHGRGWHPSVEDCASRADEPPATGSSGAGRIVGATTATGRAIGLAGAAAKPSPRPRDVDLHGPDGRKDLGGTDIPPRRPNGREVSLPPARNKAPGGGGPLREDRAEGRGCRPARQSGRHQPSFAAPFGAPRCPTDRHPSVRRCLAIPLESGRGDAGASPQARRIALPVARLGRHDASFHYREQHFVVEQDGHGWQVWPNVLASQVKASPTELRLLKGRDSRWRTEGEGPTPLWATGYREFCNAANRPSHPPQQIDITRR